MNGLLSALCNVKCNYTDSEAVGCSDSVVVMEIIVIKRKQLIYSAFYFSVTKEMVHSNQRSF